MKLTLIEKGPYYITFKTGKDFIGLFSKDTLYFYVGDDTNCVEIIGWYANGVVIRYKGVIHDLNEGESINVSSMGLPV